jgi:hypothetical protein
MERRRIQVSGILERNSTTVVALLITVVILIVKSALGVELRIPTLLVPVLLVVSGQCVRLLVRWRPHLHVRTTSVSPLPRTPPTYSVYVGESGDEGFDFDGGSSEWFVHSAAIVRTPTASSTLRIFDTVRNRLKLPPSAPLRFRELRHEARLDYMGAIVREPFRIVTLLLHIPSLENRNRFRSKNRLYFYAFPYLLDRVAACCREDFGLHPDGDGTAEVEFSKRTDLPRGLLPHYLHQLSKQSVDMNVEVDWSVFRIDRFNDFAPSSRKGLQIASTVASSHHHAVRSGNDLGYIETLENVIYRHNGMILEHGMSFMPKSSAGCIASEPSFGWVWEIK